MVPRYPGAYWRPAGTYQGAMSGLRGLSLHEAVTTATVPTSGRSNIAGWVDSADACHLFDGPDGALEQYKEFDELAWGVKDGNGTIITYESWDGLQHDNELTVDGLGANQTTWTAQQLERKADVFAWFCVTFGLPCRLMKDSTPGESGLAPHRWGIAPWRVSGGEVWTMHDGKPCPGDLRVASMSGIVARAQQIINAVSAGASWLPPGPVDLPSALARTGSPATPTSTSGELTMTPEVQAAFDAIPGKVWGARNVTITGPNGKPLVISNGSALQLSLQLIGHTRDALAALSGALHAAKVTK